MLLLATLLFFGWPDEKTVWVPKGSPCPAGMVVKRMNPCCGSMRPTLTGGETVYVEINPKGSLLGCIVSDGKKLHRVVAENERAVRLSGDSNRHSDAWEPRSNIEYAIRQVVRP